MSDFLFELFSEEIPARFQSDAECQLKERILQIFNDRGLTYASLETASTPRRLTIMVRGLPSHGHDQHLEKRGPKVEAPSQAVQKFSASLGLHPDRLIQDKGYWFARYTLAGRSTSVLLSEALPDLIHSFSWPKSMTWASRSFSWVRPLRNIVALLDDQVIPFESMNLSSCATTYGHRAWGQDLLPINGIESYVHTLTHHGVTLTRAARAQIIQTQIQGLCDKNHIVCVENPELFDEVVGLIEHPVVRLGGIPAPFMTLPEPLLITVMSHHQRYFATRTIDGSLAPYFLCITNIDSPDHGQRIMRGYERVLNARLSDAQFFYDQDRRHTPSDQATQLKNILFTQDLGTMADKAQRIASLAQFLAPSWGLDPQDPSIQTTAHLLKADLNTGVVKELPELQGLMGAHYARLEGTPDAVVLAIQEHLQPHGDQTPAPSSALGVIMALADRLDTLVGFFGVNRIPTGSKDPFGLRRAALGVVRVTWAHQDCAWSLQEAIGIAYDAYQRTGITLSSSCAHVQNTLKTFIHERMTKVLFSEHDPDIVAAVMDVETCRPLKALAQWIEALQSWRKTSEGLSFLKAYRRVDHILTLEELKDGRVFLNEPDLALMDEVEQHLAHACMPFPNDPQPYDVLTHWGILAPRIQAFFETHRINDDRPHYRINRLNLLNAVRHNVSPYIVYTRLEAHDG